MGVLNTSAKLSDVDNKLTVAAFCRRRLAVFMCMSKMAETVSAVSNVVNSLREPSDIIYRLSSSSSKGMFEWGQTTSQILHF